MDDVKRRAQLVGYVGGQVLSQPVRSLQLVDHAIERCRQPVERATPPLRYADLQVALRDGVSGRHDVGQRRGDAPKCPHRQRDRHDRQREGQAQAQHPHEDGGLSAAAKEPGDDERGGRGTAHEQQHHEAEHDGEAQEEHPSALVPVSRASPVVAACPRRAPVSSALHRSDLRIELVADAVDREHVAGV